MTITATRGQANTQATVPVEVALPPPATPSGLTATPGDLAILLNWDANDEGHLLHYNVHQGTSSGALVKVAEVPAGNESYTAEALLAGTTYHFAVSAQSTSGSLSAPSAEVSAVPFELLPFSGAHMVLAGSPGDYVEIPHHPELNPSAALTLEGWVRMDAASDCAGLIGKNYQAAYWVGDCAGLIRSYARLGGSAHTGGTFPVGSLGGDLRRESPSPLSGRGTGGRIHGERTARAGHLDEHPLRSALGAMSSGTSRHGPPCGSSASGTWLGHRPRFRPP